MGKNSKYYKDLRKSKLAKINEMKCQLPLYTHSYIEKCVLKKQINTAYAYTQDIVIFFELFLLPSSFRRLPDKRITRSFCDDVH